MSDFEIDWGEDGLHVDHDGGVDHAFADHQYEDHHGGFDGTDGADDLTDFETVDAVEGDLGDEPLDLDDVDLPDWQLDPDFADGQFDLVGADPHEDDLWSQFMTDMHEEINPYAAN
ncbi:hypothetical protein Drose_05395 [Dactylosporangium roseum]|uniref:Uncharacterized protein n=1 Tax=Dactylosporangium roseum TaxID=47989 RepID=A0ABY5Z9N5_9ACTN|nr:hypothetical protein [Dactylosporangium roseum]UWZ37708.1 hypothetical protein Drose_05395 [Dactylosporangium roseum]